MDDYTVQAVVAAHRQELASVLPGDAQVYLSGSASVPGLSAVDIDLVAVVSDVPFAARALAKIYPTLYEKQWNDEWAAFRVQGPPQVDVVLTKLGTKWDAHHRLAWNLLRDDPMLLAEYTALKRDERQKAIFFERVVRLLPPES